MNGKALMRELGEALGFELEMSGQNTCSVFFDGDEVLFEMHDDQLYIMADLGPAAGRRDAHTRMLEATASAHSRGRHASGWIPSAGSSPCTAYWKAS